MNRDDLLATHAALPGVDLDTYPRGCCVAWVESKGSTCGRSATIGRLCRRHHAVAERRLNAAVARVSDDRARAVAAAENARPGREAELARIEARLDVLDPFRSASGRGDTAEVNAPLSRRMPSDARISELARLHERRDALRSALRLT